MKIVYSNVIPFKGFAACNLFGVLFVRKRHRELFEKYPNSTRVKRYLHHEQIHTMQMKGILYIPFYIIYGVEWFVKIFTEIKAYRNVSFEREAYTNENKFNDLSFDSKTLVLNNSYAGKMSKYSWLKYVFFRKVN